MVAFTGNVGTNLIGKDSFQEVYITGITMPITKHNFVVRHVEELADTMREAFRIAQTGRKGPVLVDIPKDVTSARAEYTPAPAFRPAPPSTEYDPIAVRQAAEIINRAKRPIIYFGGGTHTNGGRTYLQELIHKADIPATHTLMAAGVLSYGDPMNLGILGMHGNFTSNKAVDEADVVVAIGTRFSDRVALNTKSFAHNATIVQIDIDPAEVSKNVPVGHSVVGDAAVIQIGRASCRERV